MSEQNKKRSRNDERRAHIDKTTGKKFKFRVEEQKKQQQLQELKDFYIGEEHPYADD